MALAVVLFAALVASVAVSPVAAAPPPKVIPGQYIVVFEDSVAQPGNLAETQTEQRGGELGFVYRHALEGYSAELSKGAVEALRRDPRVKYVSPDYEVTVATQTTPTGLDRIFATGLKALDIDETDDVRVNVDVAIIDTGVDHTHPDLNVVGRTDCTSAVCIDNTGTDGYGHGTHVGGIVGALDNDFGAVGVAPGARLWSAKVLTDKGGGNDSTIIAGIDWVTAHASQIEVANMSLGRAGVSIPMNEAIAASVDAGVLYAGAAGNFDEDASGYSTPSAPDVIAVSALSDYDGKAGGLAKQSCETNINRGKDDILAAYSNWGSVVDIAAPGTCIYSTLPTTGSLLGANYKAISGTSMASPHVAGAAAILASESNPNDREDVEVIRKELLEEGSLNWTDDSGDGAKEPLLDLRAPAREAVTLPATSLETNSATLNAVLSAGGEPATYRFEYGKTTSYGSAMPPTAKSTGSGTGDLEVSDTISVAPETTYHYRVALNTAKGTIYSEDKTFKTSHWSVQDIPEPSGEEGTTGSLAKVSCASASACVAVGTKTQSGTRAFSEQWNGSTWQIAAVPAPAETVESSLKDISCASATHCVAIGSSRKNGEGAKPMAVIWDGAKWSLLSTPPTPSGAKADPTLKGVSCTSSAHCVAVGYYVSESGIPLSITEWKTLVETWDGSGWKIQSSPNPEGNKVSSLEAISCRSSASCIAVGSTKKSYTEGNTLTLAERWDGSSWALQATPSPAGATKSVFEDVSCAFATHCMAVGNTGTNASEGFSASWSGGEWQLRSSALSGPLDGVSCASTTSCDTGGIGRHWNGVEWSEQGFATPPDVTALDAAWDVSCFAPKWGCVAVGEYSGVRYNTGFHIVAERLTPPPTSQLEAESYPATIGSTNPYGTHIWNFHTASTQCDAPQLEGSLYGPGPRLEPSAKDASCYQAYTGNELKMNGCKFIYRPGAETGVGVFKGTLDIACPTGREILFASAGSSKCQVEVSPKKDLPATYANIGSGKERAVKVTVSATGLKHAQLSGSHCAGYWGAFTDGNWNGSWKIQGSNASGQVGLWVKAAEVPKANPPISIAGSPPKLTSPAYPLTLTADQSAAAPHALTVAAGSLKCSSIRFNSAPTAATAQFPLDSEYGACTFIQPGGSFPATVKPNGCTYVSNVLNQAPVGSTYAGHADIACPEGKAIEVIAISAGLVKCTVSIPTQTTDAGGVSLTNESATSTIGLAFSVKGIDYKQTAGSGVGACATTTGTTGTYTGSSTLVGSY